MLCLPCGTFLCYQGIKGPHAGCQLVSVPSHAVPDHNLQRLHATAAMTPHPPQTKLKAQVETAALAAGQAAAASTAAWLTKLV
jgi:hypothetical protein